MIVSKGLKRVLTLGVILAILGVAFVWSIGLRKTSNRPWASYPLDKDMKFQVEQICAPATTPDDVIEACSALACRKLHFTIENNIQDGCANCIGYAQLTAAMLNHAFAAKGHPYKANPVVGSVHSMGMDLCSLSQKVLPQFMAPFFKDHDFVEISGEGRTLYVDTSLRDLTFRKFILAE